MANITRLEELKSMMTNLDKIFHRPTLEMGMWHDRNDECGTVCCAGGFAALHKPFQGQGLSLLPWRPTEPRGMLIPHYKEHHGYIALAAFFDLNSDETRFIFDPDTYPQTEEAEAIPEGHVILRIDTIMKENLPKGDAK